MPMGEVLRTRHAVPSVYIPIQARVMLFFPHKLYEFLLPLLLLQQLLWP